APEDHSVVGEGTPQSGPSSSVRSGAFTASLPVFATTRTMSEPFDRRYATTWRSAESTGTIAPRARAGREARTRIRSRYGESSEAGSRDSSATLTVAGLSLSASHGVPVVKPAPGADAS